MSPARFSLVIPVLAAILMALSCVAANPKSTQDTPTLRYASRDELLQKNFTNFVVLDFKKPGNGFATQQRLKVREYIVGEFDGKFFTGFRFTVPEWIDGDFDWLFLHANTKAQRDYEVHGMSWYICSAAGEMKGFTNYASTRLTNYPGLAKRWPYTKEATYQGLSKDRLKPGETYAIWFCFTERNVPDVVFAMTIKSKRGHKEFGKLPWR